jgi:hypothetical protein
MSVTVACDVCRRRYEVNAKRLGSRTKCQECGVSFTLAEAPESDAEGPENEESAWEGTLQVLRMSGHGVTAVAILLLLVWMGNLLRLNPRVAGEAHAQATPGQVAQSSSPENNRSHGRPAPGRGSLPDAMRLRGNPVEAIGLRSDPAENPPPTDEIRTAREENRRRPFGRRFSPPEAPLLNEPAEPSDPGRETAVEEELESRHETAFPPATGNETARDDSPDYNGPGQVPSSGRKVTSVRQLKMGQTIQIQYGRSWYPGTVLAIEGNSVRVHYNGWSNSWDETVPLSRIQLRH